MGLISKYKFYLFYSIVAFIAFWYWHVDEHYQIFEFASYKLGYTDRENLAWDFHSQIRSAILPFIGFLISKTLLLFQLYNPFFVESIARILSTILMVYALGRIMKIIREEFSISNQKYNLWFFLFWILPIVMVRFSSEAISSSLFWLGFILIYKKEVSIKKTIFIGFIWSLAFYIRLHIAILIGVYLLWNLYYRFRSLKFYLQILFGFLLATLIELLLNKWLYGCWVWSPYGYFYANIIEGAASSFGTHPWYFYITELLKNLFFPIGLFVLVGVTAYSWKYKKSIFTWFVISFILIHSFVGHKEYRFLFPIFILLAPLSYIGFFKLGLSQRLSSTIFKAVFIFNLILLPSCLFIQSFKPYNYLRLYHYSKGLNQIVSLKHDVYALDTAGRFQNVKAHFWKDKNTNVIVVDSFNAISLDIKLLATLEDHGENIVVKETRYKKVFQTLPESITKHLPRSILATIDFMYIYKKVEIN